MASMISNLIDDIHTSIYSRGCQDMSYFKRKGFNKRSIIDTVVGHSTGHRIRKPRAATIMKQNPGFRRISTVEASPISKPDASNLVSRDRARHRRAIPSFFFSSIRYDLLRSK